MRDEDISKVLKILEKETKAFKTPLINEEKRRRNNPFRILVSAILSAQTKDEITEKASKELFKHVKNAHDLQKTGLEKIEMLIYPVSFYKNKARFLKQLPEFLKNGVPDSIDELVKLPGVGRKVANLVVSVGFEKEGICVDTHVHRITNRWGYVKTKNPNHTEKVLRSKLPKKYWRVINQLLVAYGQNICRPLSPYCTKCRLRDYCSRTGVEKSR